MSATSLYQWSEVLKQRPHEIKLTGEQANKQIEQDGGQLSELVYNISTLNFLEITECTKLVNISSSISALSGLTSLVLQGNKLKSIPVELSQLTKLKCLDLSRNEIESLADGLFDAMPLLQTLNLEQNQLMTLPNMSKLCSLAALYVGSNQLINFPASLCSAIVRKIDESPIPIYVGGAIHLAELRASHNRIEDLPASIANLAALKTLDLSYNQIVIVPKELADCGKLKEFNLKVNPLKDRRLAKMIDQCPTKKILDYVRANCPALKPPQVSQPELNSKTAAADNRDNLVNKVVVQKTADPFKVIATPVVIKFRKIVACIVHNVDLSNAKVMRKFLAIQTNMHKNICEDRQKATIATHDLAKVVSSGASWAVRTKDEVVESQSPKRLVYWDGKVPTKISLVPLGRKEMTAMELYRALNEEADAYRKLKKRDTISGIHKYIHLLKGKPFFPVLMDSQANVISLPPLTNSEQTKITAGTTDILVEVTGETIPVCREVMNQLIVSLFKVTVEPDEEDNDPALVEANNSLVKKVKGENVATLLVEPVVVESSSEGSLIVKYPARIDLQSSDIQVEFD